MFKENLEGRNQNHKFALDNIKVKIAAGLSDEFLCFPAMMKFGVDSFC
jgi:hypothetical protein